MAVVHFDPKTLQTNWSQVMVGTQLAIYSIRARVTQR